MKLFRITLICAATIFMLGCTKETMDVSPVSSELDGAEVTATAIAHGAFVATKADYTDSYSDVESITDCGSFRHNITIHKMECDVLHVLLKKSSKSQKLPSTYSWVPKAKASETFANSFSLKALERLADRADKA